MAPDSRDERPRGGAARGPEQVPARKYADVDLLKVFITAGDVTCEECHEHLGRRAWITLTGDERRAFCLACADLEHLAFLPSGDAALTRRARKYSTLTAVVLKWSRARKQYERQGLLVEEEALQRAEEECLADADARGRRREREAERREGLDEAYAAAFAAAIRNAFPGCPAGRADEIAAHACLKYSGRVGRSAAAKKFGEDAIELAVAAHVRHRETGYDRLLARGVPRWEAREATQGEVWRVLDRWRTG
jgi:hypothetical protein